MPAQSPSWTIRAYRPGDERGLAGLFARCFGRPLSEEHWRWKLKRLAAPVENVWLAFDGDRPIFQYAGIPVRYQLPGGEAIAMVSVDTMTDPDFRRRGLLSEVGRRCYDAWREAGVPFVIGLPNQQWGSRTVALGWEELFPMRWLIRPLRPEALLARRLKWPALGRLAWAGALWNAIWDRGAADTALRVRPIKRAGPEFDQLWQRCRDETRISVVRDSAWVDWRYLTAPSHDYRVLLAERDGQPAGYIAYRLEMTTGAPWGFIAELLAPQDDPTARRALIACAVSEMRAAGAVAATVLAVPRTRMHAALRRAGFVLGRAGFFSVQIVPLVPDLPIALVRDPTNWDIAGGDFDVI
jgi:hypothetical protein